MSQNVFHIYAPYDMPGVVQRFLQIVQPKIAIMMETELWPNIFHFCAAEDIPVVVANARLSERSARRYACFKNLTKEMLSDTALVIAQTQADGQRFIDLGLPADRLAVTGSIKFDIQLPASLYETGEVLRQQWGANRPIWIAASTHEGEEEVIFSAFSAIRDIVPQTLLVIVPRHSERFGKIAAMSRKLGYETVQRTEQRPCSSHTDVFIGDTMGELLLFYAASDVAFVGGSFSQTGGHNILEPSALGLPVVVGPNMINFLEITRLVSEAGGCKQVFDENQLAQTVLHWLQHSDQRSKAGEAGRTIVEKNRGALNRHLEALAPLL